MNFSKLFSVRSHSGRLFLIITPSSITVTGIVSFSTSILRSSGVTGRLPGFGVQELIEQSRYSYQQIYHKVKSTTGESINEFIRDIRLKRAAQYLANSDMRIQEVMYAVGFNTHSYFTKCFKKYFGCSPTTFAEKHKELSD